MKNILEKLVWLPLLGAVVMLFLTKFGRYRTDQFAGLAWGPYQMACLVISLLIF